MADENALKTTLKTEQSKKTAEDKNTNVSGLLSHYFFAGKITIPVEQQKIDLFIDDVLLRGQSGLKEGKNQCVKEVNQFSFKRLWNEGRTLFLPKKTE